MRYFSRLWLALTQKDFHELKNVLEKAKVTDMLPKVLEYRNDHNWTPLFYAAENGLDVIASVLLEYGAVVDSRNGNFDETPLMAACKNGHVELAIMLRYAGADMSLQNANHWTVLMICAYNNREELIRRLVRGDGSDSVTPSVSESSVMLGEGEASAKTAEMMQEEEEAAAAAQKGEEREGGLRRRTSSIVIPLRNNRANILKNKGRKHSSAAVESGDGATDETSRRQQKIVLEERHGKMFLAATRGDLKGVEKMLKVKGVNVNYKDKKTGNTCLIVGSMNEDLPMISLLLLFAADVTLLNLERQSAFDVGSDSARKLMMPLVKRPVPLPADLLKAAWLGSGSQLEALLNFEGAMLNVNCKNEDGLSPLLLLSRDIDTMKTFAYLDDTKEFFQYSECSRTLIDHNAEVNISDPEGSSPLHFACANNDVGLVSLMLGNNATVDAKNVFQNAPIHYACLKGNCDNLMKLIKAGSNVNCAGYGGDTPLHIACYSDHKQAASILIEHGANGDSVDESGRSPLDVAKSAGIKRLVKTWLAKQRRLLKGAYTKMSTRPTMTPQGKNTLKANNMAVLDKNYTKDKQIRHPVARRSQDSLKSSSSELRENQHKGALLFNVASKELELTAKGNSSNALPVFKGSMSKTKSSNAAKLRPVKKSLSTPTPSSAKIPGPSTISVGNKSNTKRLEPIRRLVSDSSRNVSIDSDGGSTRPLVEGPLSVKASQEAIEFMGFMEETLAQSWSSGAGGIPRIRSITDPSRRSITPGSASGNAGNEGPTKDRTRERLPLLPILGQPGFRRSPLHSPRASPRAVHRQRSSVPVEAVSRGDLSVDEERRLSLPFPWEVETIEEIVDLWNSHRRGTNMRRVEEPVKWQRGHVLGRGAFGKVYMGLNEDTGEMIAIKQIPIANDDALDGLTQELDLLKRLNHPHIVRYLGAHHSEEEKTMSILMEYIPGGSLTSLISRFHGISENVTRIFMKQILEAVQYLHANGVIHRDIKGGNVLVDSDGSIRLADFGASKIVDIAHDPADKSMIGTPYYLAPEVIKQENEGYGYKSDVYSIGCTMYEMLLGKPPFGDLEPMAAIFRVGNGETPRIPEDSMSPEAARLLGKMLALNPDDRPEIEEILEDEYLTFA
eukprot:Nk52_evm6s211 gene=Nk52_evmTU6s211